MAITSDHFLEILKYPFQDKQWFSKLILQGAVLFMLSMIFVGIPFMAGYVIVLKQKAIDSDSSLSGWSDWGNYWKLGWKSILVGFVYALPIFFVSGFVMFLGLFVALFLENAGSGEEWIAFLFFIPLGIALLLIIATSVALYFIQPAYQAAIAAGATVRQCFQIKL
ncbi:MAG: DUF4013 domain-containing protein [bacterium]|nr:DUF4013 domain-containing protein [bacterium]